MCFKYNEWKVIAMLDFTVFTEFQRCHYYWCLYKVGLIRCWIVRLYYYGFLVNEGIVLVIQTIDLSALSVLYSKDVYPMFHYFSFYCTLITLCYIK